MQMIILVVILLSQLDQTDCQPINIGPNFQEAFDQYNVDRLDTAQVMIQDFSQNSFTYYLSNY
jgi:hypothetical protein